MNLLPGTDRCSRSGPFQNLDVYQLRVGSVLPMSPLNIWVISDSWSDEEVEPRTEDFTIGVGKTSIR